MDGKSLRTLVEGKNVEWREELFLESLFTLRGNPFCEGIRKGNWKYIRMYTGINNYTETDLNFKKRNPDFEQLFDLDNDPTEHINLIKDYEGKPLLEELRIKCEKYSENLNKKREDYKTKFHIETKK